MKSGLTPDDLRFLRSVSPHCRCDALGGKFSSESSCCRSIGSASGSHWPFSGLSAQELGRGARSSQDVERGFVVLGMR